MMRPPDYITLPPFTEDEVSELTYALRARLVLLQKMRADQGDRSGTLARQQLTCESLLSMLEEAWTEG